MRPPWFVLLALLLSPPARAQAPDLSKWIDQLGEGPAQRQAATKKLDELGEAALPALRKAAKSHPDIDVRLRAGIVAASIHARLYTRPVLSFDNVGGGDCNVVFSPDGKSAVSGGSNEVRVWSIALRRRRHILKGHTAGVIGVALAKDGKTAASAAGDGTVRLWDIDAGKELRVLRGHLGAVYCVAFTPDGKRLVSGGNDGLARVWDVAKGEVVHSLASDGGVRALAISADGKRCLTAHLDGALGWWDLEAGRRLARSSASLQGLMAVALSPDGKQALCGGFSNDIILWDLEKREALARLPAGTWIKWLHFGPPGHFLSCGHDGVVRLWSLGTRRQAHRWEDHVGAVWGLGLSPDGRTLLSSGEDRTLKLWRVPAGE